MAATASHGPLRFFQEPSCSIATSHFYSSAELAFTNKPPSKTERVKKRRYSPPSPPLSQSLVQEERKTFTESAPIAPLSRGFGDSNSFPRLSGMVVCPHLHPLAHEPETKSRDRTSKYYSAATFITAASTIDEERENAAVHQLDTRSAEAKEEDCWSPLTQENSEHTDDDDNEDGTRPAVDRYSTSPPPLPAPCLDSLTSTERGSWSMSTSGEDPPQQATASFCNDTRATEQAVVASDSVQETINITSTGDGANKSNTPGKRRRLLHRPLARQRATAQNTSNHLSPPNQVHTSHRDDKFTPTSSSDSQPGKLLLISPENDAPVVLGRTKPVPPPKTPSSEIDRQCKIPSAMNHQSPPQDHKQSSSPNRHPTKILHPTISSPAILSESTGSSPFQRSRLVSFHHCKAGETLGQFKADYLGSKEVDGYVCMVNSVAKQLVDQRPAEVIAYVSSQKIRLAPSRNESVLFKSFAIKDILMVEKCTINKRIIGIVIWKSKSRPPTCHILRFPDEITSKSFYEAVWEQSQIYDDATLNKVSQ